MSFQYIISEIKHNRIKLIIQKSERTICYVIRLKDGDT